jgi:ferric-dicitrate binding protein FerR (iron transport regulator)
MKTKPPYAFGLALLATLAIVLPNDILAEPQAAGQRAGEVSRIIPAVSIARGSKTLTASAKTPVDWLDVLNTQASARARVALDDGSVLNVGADSSLKVVRHDGGAQQTELELAYGKLRSQAQKITKTDGKFEVKTPAGVAGVVGTDFYIAFDQTAGQMNLVVFEGLVKLCNNAGVCVMVKAGQMSSVRNTDNSSPLQPTQATLNELTEAVNTTFIGDKPGSLNAGTHLSHGWTTVGILSVIPVIVIPVLVIHNTHNPPLPPPPTGCGQTGTKGC